MKLIDWEDVNKIIDEGIDEKNENKNKNMKLVNLEDVKKIIENNKNTWDSGDSAIKYIEIEINSLPTNDPIAVLKEMIEELMKVSTREFHKKDPILLLEEAISRITNHNNQGQNN